MFIQVQETPNPDTLKFLPGQDVMSSGTAEFKSIEQAQSSQLAQRLFSLEGVIRVFYGHDFISVSKTDNKQWLLLKPRILGMIMEHFSSKQPLMIDDAVQSNSSDINEDDDEITKQIKELLDTRVRPAVAMDGGDIVFQEFTDGVLYLKMQGVCAGCPSSTATLKHGIENMMRHFIPEVEEVRAVEDIS